MRDSGLDVTPYVWFGAIDNANTIRILQINCE